MFQEEYEGSSILTQLLWNPIWESTGSLWIFGWFSIILFLLIFCLRYDDNLKMNEACPASSRWLTLYEAHCEVFVFLFFFFFEVFVFLILWVLFIFQAVRKKERWARSINDVFIPKNTQSFQHRLLDDLCSCKKREAEAGGQDEGRCRWAHHPAVLYAKFTCTWSWLHDYVLSKHPSLATQQLVSH